jgi:hypothetical protein
MYHQWRPRSEPSTSKLEVRNITATPTCLIGMRVCYYAHTSNKQTNSNVVAGSLMFGVDCTSQKQADRVLRQPLANAISIHGEDHKRIHCNMYLQRSLAENLGGGTHIPGCLASNPLHKHQQNNAIKGPRTALGLKRALYTKHESFYLHSWRNLRPDFSHSNG